MAFASSLSARPHRGAAGGFIDRCAAYCRLRQVHVLLVVFAMLWVVIAPVSTLVGWLTGELELVVTLLGAFLLFTVSCASLLISVLVVLRHSRRGSSPPNEPFISPPMIELAPGWSTEPKSQSLGRFLQNFEESLAALRLRLLDLLGEEMARSLPLHQQIAFATELEIWSGSDLEAWRECLTVRTRILTEGADLSLAAVNGYALWLDDLSHRTLPSLSH